MAEAGLGKTTVLDGACQLAGPGARVARARSDATETWLPFGLIDQAIDADESMEPPWGPVPSAARAGRCYQTLRWLEKASAPLVLLALDDLHWADPDSLALVSFLCRRISSLHVAVIATLRPWPRDAADAASALAHAGFASIERLRPLSEHATSALLTSHLGRELPETVTKRALELCGGNPLLLGEVAAAIARGEELPEPDAEEPLGSAAQLLLPRFAGVSPEGLRLARAASVFGTAFWPQLAADVAQLEGSELDGALEALTAAGLLREAGSARAEFVHPLFRHVLYEDLAPPVRARLHTRAFRALAHRASPAEAAAHAIRAELVGDPEAVTVLERTGREALQAGALSTAVRHLERAAAFAGTQASSGLLLALAEALLASGQLNDAVATCRRVVVDPEPATRIAALRMLARALALQGAHTQARASFEEARALADACGPAASVEVLLDQALASWLTGGPAAALPVAAHARALATDAHVEVARRAEVAWGFLATLSGDPGGLDALSDAARPVLDDALSFVDELHWAWGTLSVYGMAATLVERFVEAELAFSRGLWAAERVGAVEAFANLAIPYAGMLSRVGRLDQSLAMIGRAGALAELAPMNETYVAVGHAYVLLQMGRIEEAESWCQRIEVAAPARGEWVALLYLWDVRAQHRLGEGRVDEACDLYDQAQETTNRLGIAEPCAVPWARNAIRAHLGAGRHQDARRVIAWVEDHLGRLPCRWPRIVVATGHALLAERTGEHETAEAHFRQALSLHAEAELPLEQGETLLDFGAFLRRRGRLAEARPLLAQALALAEERGAGWLGGRAQAELGVAGGRRRRDHKGALTPQQQRVARLAARGLTNQEIATRLVVSEGTVETHLSQIYAKLDIRSRRELMALALQEQGQRALGDPKDQGNP